MKFDFSYVDIVLKAAANEGDINEITSTIAYDTIQKHVKMTGSKFNVNMLIDALNGATNAGYGLRNLSQNLNDIKKIVAQLKTKTNEWQTIISKEVTNIFKNCNLSQTIICPVIGYDIGIGIDNVVCINLNVAICKDIKEIFSIAIHETAHTVSEQLEKYFDFTSKNSFLQTISYLIQYEGIGIFSAYNYRTVNDLPYYGYPALEDYIISDIKYENLKNLYNTLTEMNNNSLVSLEEMKNKTYSGKRLTHRLGYEIVFRAYKQHGIQEVRSIAQMSNDEFKSKYLL
ncbi:hypothetical protein IMX26_06335 [Clostridium sp. 'deep sea']|uniref:DUF5700 domain-containing putative Zn-dependent protease n=1 Tax=Clostridium sp. 'deep sea' TaxID=2779445 RepID=UPI0018966A1B|nr:DUF5700 domain-containing putative Zn-dependent protease [Clostridium sp. 'deep sea']QOR36424.1 hypothetical protein IMX26_06335 [Clostridium sp. 'deep sea']